MPLTRSTVTASSQLMLPTYPVFALVVGLSYVLGDPSRTASPAFDYVRDIMPIAWWGCMFIAISAGMTTALLLHHRRVMVAALCFALGCYSMWVVGYMCSLFNVGNSSFPSLNPDMPFTAVWLWSFVCVAHVASLRSLTRDVVIR